MYCSCHHSGGFNFVFQFNPVSKLSEGDQFYNSTVNPNDTVDVLVFVIPADTARNMRDETVQKIREIRIAASRLGESINQYFYM